MNAFNAQFQRNTWADWFAFSSMNLWNQSDELNDNGKSEQFAIPIASLPAQKLQPVQLCNACTGLNIEALRDRLGYLHSNSIHDLVSSAKTCPLCERIQSQICDALKARSKLSEKPKDALGAHVIHSSIWMALRRDSGLDTSLNLQPQPSVHLALTTGLHNIGNLGSIATITCLEDPVLATSMMIPWSGFMVLHNNENESLRPIRPRGSDEEVLSRLRQWVDKRLEEVPQWSDAAEEKPLPTRTLDLGEAKTWDANLCLAETGGQHGHYVALSYCWGGYKDFCLLRENYAERLRQIKYDQLPPVFAHAVKVTRGLGIRYLWIDALCIIQEDKGDWSREAACMSDVYWNTVCRIAVNDSKSPLEGFFPPQELCSIRLPGLESQFAREFQRTPTTNDSDGSSRNMEMNSEVGDDIKTEEIRPEGIELVDDAATSEHTDEGTSTCGGTKIDANDEGPIESLLWNLHAASGVSDDVEEISPSMSQTIFANGVAKTVTGLSIHGLAVENSPKSDHDFQELYDGSIESDESGSSNDEDRDLSDNVDNAECLTHGQSGCSTDIYGNEEHHVRSDENEPLEVYLTSPRSYATDVDHGHLNTRGWVLQERLLAPRTIHFTSEHIYCEDQNDICGEDWVKRYFTWLSSIFKKSRMSQVELVPERNFLHKSNYERNIKSRDFIWIRREAYNKPEDYHVQNPWLRICEAFSRCNLTFQSDRLAAMAGLIKKKHEVETAVRANNRDDILCQFFASDDGLERFRISTGRENSGRDFLALWEDNLHIELAWVAHHQSKLRFLRDLNLASWAWIAYEGGICFVGETDQTVRDVGKVNFPPLRACELLQADVPETGTISLPLISPASLTLRLVLRKIHAVSDDVTSFDPIGKTRDEISCLVPFSYYDRSLTNPVLMASISKCKEILDPGSELVGFLSFDEESLITGELFCAHISTLTDRVQVEGENLDNLEILAYALVLEKVKGTDNDFKRVGFAEVNYEWMDAVGEETTIRVF